MQKPIEELARRVSAAAVRLSPFRGEMCDDDFAQLVKDVVRIRDNAEGRAPMYPWDRLSVSFPPLPA
ncbi:MAG: hypothetical protein QOK07_1223 [Gemmatimonadaceae bacterium]|nr:hypothetical protein [Gemmatimonadaceae bacterium]